MQLAMHVGVQNNEIGAGLPRAHGRRKKGYCRWARAADLVACENGLETGQNWA